MVCFNCYESPPTDIFTTLEQENEKLERFVLQNSCCFTKVGIHSQNYYIKLLRDLKSLKHEHVLYFCLKTSPTFNRITQV